ncbi:hypothetical protein HWV62_24530 [Athelia sp. TMB]|nr:hypothetical protein HWV62_24530 [Athelia sp. TMB]
MTCRANGRVADEFGVARVRPEHMDAGVGSRSRSLLPFNDAPVDLISSCFTGREEELLAISSVLDSCAGNEPARHAIWGMPGLGKSQAALKYAHSSYASGSHTHIFWISATTTEKASQGLAKVLELVNHPSRQNSDQAARTTAARLCLEHPQEYGFRRWLIILDNATIESLPFLRENLPRQNGQGSILITTRTRDIAESLSAVAGQQHAYAISELKALDLQQSTQLLFKRAGIYSAAAVDLGSAERLIKRIGCLPLAVEQAGAFLKRSGLSGADQLETLYDKGGLVTEVNRKTFTDAAGYAKQRTKIIGWGNNLTTYEARSVVATFAAQLERLRESNLDALKLLYTLSFFDPERITIDIVAHGARMAGRLLADNKRRFPLIPKSAHSLFRMFDKTAAERHELQRTLGLFGSEEWLREALRHFEDLSLAQPLHGERTALRIHDLIQLVLRQSAMADHKSQHFARAVTILYRAFRSPDCRGSARPWAECERFVPHVISLAKHHGTAATASEDFKPMVRLFIRCLIGRERYSEAEPLCKAVLADHKKRLGSGHKRTIRAKHELARVYLEQRKYLEAQKLLERLQSSCPTYRGLMTTLATWHKMQGNYDKAETLFRQQLAGSERIPFEAWVDYVPGVDGAETLAIVQNLGELCRGQGRYDEAAALFDRALVGNQRLFGANDARTLLAMYSIAFLYDQQGKYADAEILYQRTLAGQESQLGVNHRYTRLSSHRLAVLYMKQGKYAEAETLFQKSLAGKEKQLGADHLDTLRTVSGIAELYKHQGRYEESARTFSRVLAGQERRLEKDHPDTLQTARNLAYLLQLLGRYDETENLLLQALPGMEKQHGTGHPKMTWMTEWLAEVYERQGRCEEAEMLRGRRNGRC